MKSKTVELKLIQNDGTEFTYTMRPMESEEPGSDEMRRRIAFKTGFRMGALQALFLLDENIDEAMGRMAGFEVDYFNEGRALGLSCSDYHSEPELVPWGQLTCNGGTPLLPLLSDRLDLFPEDLRV